MEYRWENSTSTATPVSASDTVNQQKKLGGITFRAALEPPKSLWTSWLNNSVSGLYGTSILYIVEFIIKKRCLITAMTCKRLISLALTKWITKFMLYSVWCKMNSIFIEKPLEEFTSLGKTECQFWINCLSIYHEFLSSTSAVISYG